MKLNKAHPTLFNLSVGSGMAYSFLGVASLFSGLQLGNVMLSVSLWVIGFSILGVSFKYDAKLFRILFVVSTFISTTLLFILMGTMMAGITPPDDLGLVTLLALFSLVQYSVATEPPINPISRTIKEENGGIFRELKSIKHSQNGSAITRDRVQ